jgi:3-carboxy-cis,cis-muconate cycloisomerase
MPTNLIDSAIFRDVYGTPEMRAVFDDRALVQAWLDVEAALAGAEAEVGLIPTEAAEEIVAHCRAELIDLDQLKSQTELVGYPILPLVRQVEKHCRDDLGAYIHWGATTQDITDTGTILQLARARDLLLERLGHIEVVLAGLAREHRDTVMAGRTHGQQAAPITLGYKLAVWLAELRRHRERFEDAADRLLVGQFAGAVGTLASLGGPGLEVQALMLRSLGLGAPPISWHTARDSLAEFACLLALLCTTLGKIAQEVALLQKTETAELEEGYEPGRGGSSTMPQKRNPIACEAILDITKQVRARVGPAIEDMLQDHERKTGRYHLEWGLLPEMCVLSHAALTHTLDLLRSLVVRPERMKRNLALSEGLIVSEAVMMRLAPHLGRQRAHDLIYEACMAAFEGGPPLRELLPANPDVAGALSADELDQLLDPANYTGLAGTFVDRVLAQMRA